MPWSHLQTPWLSEERLATLPSPDLTQDIILRGPVSLSLEPCLASKT